MLGICMRPRITQGEIRFILRLLKQAKEKADRELAEMKAELDRLSWQVPELKRKFMWQNSHMFAKPYHEKRDRLHQLEREYWDRHFSEPTILKGLVMRFERFLEDGRGRLPYASQVAQRRLLKS